MKALFHAAALAALLTAGVAAAQTPTTPPPPAADAAPAPALPAHQEVFMPMRDGTVLAANVYLPAGAGPWPVILQRTPYLKDPDLSKAPPQMLAGLAASINKYTAAGYAFVVQDVRGKGHSKGFYSAFSDDIPDGYDTVEWVAKQPWSNGKVGITGSMAAIAAPPHLAAAYIIVAPQERQAYEYPGGVLKEQDSVGWTKGQGETGEQIARIYDGEVDNLLARRNDMGQGLPFIRIPI